MYHALEADLAVGLEAADCNKAGSILVGRVTAAKQATHRK